MEAGMTSSLIEGGPPREHHIWRRNRVFEATTDGACRMIDRCGGRGWDLPALPQAPYEYFPRNLHAVYFDSTVWSDDEGQVVAHIVNDPPGVRVVARDGGSGTALWEYYCPLPPAAPWAGAPTPQLARSKLPAEVLEAFLTTRTDSVVLCIQRHARDMIIWGEVEDFPPWNARLDLIGLDPSTGQVLWQSELDDVYVNIMEHEDFVGLHCCGRAARDLDFRTGKPIPLLDCPGKPAWPRLVGKRVACAWHGRGRVGVAWIDRATGQILARQDWHDKRAKELWTHRIGDKAIVQINQTRYVLIGDDGGPRWELQAKHWFRGLELSGDGALILETSSCTYKVDFSTGAILGQSKSGRQTDCPASPLAPPAGKTC
jgi:outer membrane protein assembly factor BamB